MAPTNLRRQPLQEPVHELAPAPEGVAARPAPLGASRERALKGMAVEVCRRRQENPAGKPSIAGFRLHFRLDAENSTVRANSDPYVACPAVAQKRKRRVQ